MRIAIDGRWIFPQISGIGRVTEKLVFHLGKLDRENHYLVIFNDSALRDRYRKLWEDFSNIETELVPWPPFSPRSHLLLPRLLKRRGTDLFHSTNFLCPLLPGGPRMVVTVHDLIPLKFPHFTPRAKKTRFNFAFRWLLRRSLARADRVIAVSRHTRSDLIGETGLDAGRIAVVYNGIDERYRPREPSGTRELLKERYGIDRPYFLFVGRLDPYKNLPRLIEAYARYCRRNGSAPDLIIVAAPDPRYPDPRDLASRLNLGSRFKMVEGVREEDDLVSFYNGAVALVLPSLYEGFGLPPLEAMACGTPVICSDRASLPEVVGDAAVLVDPERTEAIADALGRVAADPGLRQSLGEKGLRRAAAFSWEKTAEATAAVYREIMSTPVHKS